MGWRPWEVRRCLPWDLDACFEGWQMSQGIDPNKGLGPSDDDLDALRTLKERFPDGR